MQSPMVRIRSAVGHRWPVLAEAGSFPPGVLWSCVSCAMLPTEWPNPNSYPILLAATISVNGQTLVPGRREVRTRGGP